MLSYYISICAWSHNDVAIKIPVAQRDKIPEVEGSRYPGN